MKHLAMLLTLSLLLASVPGLTAGAQLPASPSQNSWELLEPSPAATMAHAVAWAVHDGGLWSIGGYFGDGVTQRYDPATDTWTTHAVEPEPWTAPFGDGCYGMDWNGHEVIVLFPPGPDRGLHTYNITLDEWLVSSPPDDFPADGLTGQDVVSLYNVIGKNVCYISGGSSGTGSLLTDLWEFHPDTYELVHLGNFDHTPTGFFGHASWYLPWGALGSVCVGGGVGESNDIYAATQCYDIAGDYFGDPNNPLGPLPEPWAYMADGWKIHEGRYQMWLANGVDEDMQPLQASAYLDSQVGHFVYGPSPSVALANTEGDSYRGNFYVEQGYSYDTDEPATDNLHLVQPAEPPCEPEVVFFEDFEGSLDQWEMDGLWNLEAEGDDCGPLAAPFPSATHAFYYGQDGVCTYDTGDTTAGVLAYQLPIDLTYYTSATLTFWSYEETECGDGNCDHDLRFVDVAGSLSGLNPVWGSSGPEGEWYRARADLTPYTGQALNLIFHFDSNDSDFNDYLGWLVDDVTVTGCRSCQQRWYNEPPVPETVGSSAAVLEYGGALLVLGGSDSGGNSHGYVPIFDRWLPLAPMSPTIQFPADGAFGETPDGPRAFILDDSTPGGPEGAMIYDLSALTWIHDADFPVPERYDHDMAEDRDNNLIYVTGGMVSGMLDELWIYDPWDDSATQGPGFDTPRRAHASWYVPWLGAEGYLCIAGGETDGLDHLSSTQCYDVASESWRAENADLGLLPETWRSMGDAVKVHDGCPQLWMVGGVMAGEPTTRTLYFDLCDDQWHWGEDLQVPSLSSSEAVAVPALGEIYAFPLDTFTQHHLQPCPDCQEITSADFAWTPPHPAISHEVTLTASADGSGLVTFDWDLGDGAKARGPSVTHTYVATGTYSVVMTASNPCGAAGITATHDVIVGMDSEQYRLYVPLVVRESP